MMPIIVPLYEKIHLTAEHVMELTEKVIKDTDLGLDSRSKILSAGRILTRTFLTSSKSYKKFRRQYELPFGISKVYCELQMPKFIWVCEISLPDLYAEGKIVGELVFDATANQFDRFAFLVIHYPDFLIINDRHYLTDDPKRFIIRDVAITDILPYSCYVNNLCEV